MTEEKITELQSGFNTAFINSKFNSNLAYRPQFIYNDNKNGQKVFSAIEDELFRCDSFAISVAFITRGEYIVSPEYEDIEIIGDNIWVCYKDGEILVVETEKGD